MDYVLGNVAALISGNVTPNRPKLSKRASTPVKQMPSPNVTPKSEFVEDRSIFLSPTMQKKKAIVKKSPKRIFQNPELDVTDENLSNSNVTSPKADKVKKHLKNELEAHVDLKTSAEGAKTPKKKLNKPAESTSPKKNVINEVNCAGDVNHSNQELTPKKKKKKRNSVTEMSETAPQDAVISEESPKKNKKQRKETATESFQITEQEVDSETKLSPKKKKKNRNTVHSEEQVQTEVKDIAAVENEVTSPKKKNKKRKKVKTDQNIPPAEITDENDGASKPKRVKKVKVNPNAVTDKDTDSEHESDDDIASETEENNREVLENSAEADQSTDEEGEETPNPKVEKVQKEKAEEKVKEVNTEEEIKRTLFVGNVPFSKKCKKEIKKIFSKYGEIESVRIRTVPVKDPSVTPKVAVIKQELHPERTTVNVYVKFSNPRSMEDALVENNTILNNNHLRVTRSASTGAEHDPRCSIFVGNIPFALEDEGLREKFEKCGEIESVRIVRDKKTNAGKGFGYVNFTSKDGVELALGLSDEDLTIKNRIMRVKRCTQHTQKHTQKGQKGPNRGPNRGPNAGPNRGQIAGHNRGPNTGPNRGPNAGPNRGPNRGPNAGLNRGPNTGPNRSGPPNRQGFQKGKVSQGNRQRNFQGKGNFQRGGDGRQEDHKEGAYRRVAEKKRKIQDGSEGPPGKKPREDQPQREKKAKKEFVGMTAEKKKKRKFDKGQKKKKALSEILTK